MFPMCKWMSALSVTNSTVQTLESLREEKLFHTSEPTCKTIAPCPVVVMYKHRLLLRVDCA